MNTILLVFAILLIDLLSFLFLDKKLSTPSFAFNFSILISLINGLTNYRNWNFNLGTNTVILLFLCSFTFTIIGCLVHIMKDKRRNYINNNTYNNKYFVFSNRINYLFFFIQILNALLMLYFIKTAGIKYGASGSLSESIGVARKTSVAFDNVTLVPAYISSIDSICFGLCYIYIFFTLRNFILFNKKPSAIIVINWLVSIASPFLNGSRGSSVSLALSFLLFYLLFSEKKTGRNPIGLKPILLLVFLSVLILFSFVYILQFIGRDLSGLSPYYYISVYIGAPMKNFDIYLRSYLFPSYSGLHVFPDLIRFISPDSIYGVASDTMRQFVNFNGYDLGNVNTAFAGYIDDFGYLGCIILVSFMSIFSHLLYETAINPRGLLSEALSTITYSIIFSGLLLIFFSDRIYRIVFSPTFLKYLIIWSLIILIIKNRENK